MTMSTLLFRALMGLLMFGVIGANAMAADCDSPITADEALKAEDARYVVQANLDFDAMQRVFGDDLVYIHSTGAADNKESYIERQRAGLHYLGMTRDNAKVRVFGCLAIITGAASITASVKDVERTLHLMFHSVWVKRGSEMRFTSWESTIIPPKP